MMNRYNHTTAKRMAASAAAMALAQHHPNGVRRALAAMDKILTDEDRQRARDWAHERSETLCL